MKVFAVHGFFVGVAAILFATQLSIIQSTVPPNLELSIITASVVGGVSILGGTGTVVGSTLAAILIAAIGSSLIFINISPYWLRAVQGVLILLTVLADLCGGAGGRGGDEFGAGQHENAGGGSVARSVAPPRGHPGRHPCRGADRARAAERPLPHGRQPAQPGPADGRGRAGRAAHDLHHHHRRHRSVGRARSWGCARSCSASWKNLGLPLAGAIVVALAAGTAAGFFNGLVHHAGEACRR